LSRNESGRFGALKSDSTHHFFRNACTKSGSSQSGTTYLNQKKKTGITDLNQKKAGITDLNQKKQTLPAQNRKNQVLFCSGLSKKFLLFSGLS
jgi:hypothetical protein